MPFLWCRSCPGASQAAVVSVLSNLQDLCAEDPSLEAALREAQIVIDGGGEPAQVSDLFDPAVDELLGLLGPEAFPAEAFCTPAVRFGFVCVSHVFVSLCLLSLCLMSCVFMFCVVRLMSLCLCVFMSLYLYVFCVFVSYVFMSLCLVFVSLCLYVFHVFMSLCRMSLCLCV